MQGLKNCPFCNGMARKFSLRTVNYTHKATYAAEVGCDKCNALMIGTGLTPEEAWKDAYQSWNKRYKEKS